MSRDEDKLNKGSIGVPANPPDNHLMPWMRSQSIQRNFSSFTSHSESDEPIEEFAHEIILDLVNRVTER